MVHVPGFLVVFIVTSVPEILHVEAGAAVMVRAPVSSDGAVVVTENELPSAALLGALMLTVGFTFSAVTFSVTVFAAYSSVAAQVAVSWHDPVPVSIVTVCAARLQMVGVVRVITGLLASLPVSLDVVCTVKVVLYRADVIFRPLFHAVRVTVGVTALLWITNVPLADPV